jgi:tRNA U55 pseudouridine synthase TruB
MLTFDVSRMMDNQRNEAYLRKIIQPLETLLVGYKRIVVKDSTVNAICYGKQATRDLYYILCALFGHSINRQFWFGRFA